MDAAGLRLNRLKDDSTHFITILHAGVAVKRAGIIATWKNIFFIFSIYAWIGIFLAVLILSGILTAIEQKFYIFEVICLLYTSTDKMPQKLSSKILYTFWMCMAYILQIMFVSVLLSFLTQPLYEKQIKTYEELLQSGTPMIGTRNFRQYINRPNYPYSNLYESFIETEDLNRIVVDTVAFKTAGLTAIESIKAFVSINWWNKKKDLRLFIIPEPLDKYLLVMYLRHGFPMKTRINDLIFKMHDNGLIQKWIVDEIGTTPQVASDKEFLKLTVNHILGLMYLYLIGIVTALIIFFVEHFY